MNGRNDVVGGGRSEGVLLVKSAYRHHGRLAGVVGTAALALLGGVGCGGCNFPL